MGVGGGGIVVGGGSVVGGGIHDGCCGGREVGAVEGRCGCEKRVRIDSQIGSLGAGFGEEGETRRDKEEK